PGGQGDVPAVVVDVGLDAGFHLVGQLVAGGGEHFDAVELHRVVGRRDGDARVRLVLGDEVGHRGGGQNAQGLHVGPHAAQAGGQGGFQHIPRLAGVLADQDAGPAAS